MKKTVLLFVCLLLAGSSVLAQKAPLATDIRMGIGTSLLGSGDMQTIMVDNEINVGLNQLFTVGAGLGFGKSDDGVFEQASFLQINANVYFSPWRNTRRNDFRIGTGLTWYNVSDVYRSSSSFLNGELVSSEHVLDTRSSFGYNIVLENTYLVTDRFLLGDKLFTQPYFNGDINSGGMLRLGLRL